MSKSLRIEKAPSAALYRIVWNNGGELPHTLRGSYTSRHAAELAIKVWSGLNDRDVEITLPEEHQEPARRGRPPKSI